MSNSIGEGVVGLVRAGFWRRVLALTLDFLILTAPFQIAVMLLFPMTDGRVQMDGGLSFNYCRNSAAIPTNLSPAPPEGSNYAQMCQNSFAGYTKALTVTVGKETHDGATTTNVVRTYRVDTKGNVDSAYAIDWIAQLALLAYLIVSLKLAGQTLGMRALRIEVLETATGAKPSWRRAVLRYVFQLTGLLPLLVPLLYVFAKGADFANGAPGSLGAAFVLLAAAGVFAFIWGLANLVAIVRKRDPLYDRWAGTALVRRA